MNTNPYATPDDLRRAKMYERLKAALEGTMQPDVTEAQWTELGNALTAIQAQKALNARNKQLDKETR